MVKTGAVDTIVCWKVDRVARNARELLNFIHDIEEAGGGFASVTQQFDTTTAMGRAMLTIIGALAEMESEIKSERTEIWHDLRRSTGAPPTGNVPFGYRRERSELIVEPKEANAIRAAATDLLAGRSVRSLVAELNATMDRTFTPQGLTRILTSPTTAALREIDGQYVASPRWEPVLSRDVWDQVRAKLSDPRRRTSPPSPARKWLLGGLLSCDQPEGCEGYWRAKATGKKGTRYTCSTCNLSIGAPDLDAYVEAAVLGALDPKAWRKIQSQGDRRIDVSGLEKQLAELAARPRVSDLSGANLSKVLKGGALLASEWEVLRAGILEQLAAAAAEPVHLPAVADPRREWPLLEVDAKRLIVNSVISRIIVGPAVPGAKCFDPDRITLEPAANISSLTPLQK